MEAREGLEAEVGSGAGVGAGAEAGAEGSVAEAEVGRGLPKVVFLSLLFVACGLFPCGILLLRLL